MLPEEFELQRLHAEQAASEDEVIQAELSLETLKTDVQQFQRRYYQTVGRLFAELDAVNAEHAARTAAHRPSDADAQAAAAAAREQARRSAEEAGISEQIPAAVVITPELKATYRQACKHMHPDRATTEAERLRRTHFMARVNVAYEAGDEATIKALLDEYGADTEALIGHDIGTQMVKAIRRIAQLRRRLSEITAALSAVQDEEIYSLKASVESAEALGGDPLGDLARDLLQQLSESKIAAAHSSSPPF